LILNSLRPIPEASYQCTSREMDGAIGQPNASDPLTFAPTTAAVDPSQPRALADCRACGESLGVGNLAQNLELHPLIVSCHIASSTARTFNSASRGVSVAHETCRRLMEARNPAVPERNRVTVSCRSRRTGTATAD